MTAIVAYTRRKRVEAIQWTGDNLDEVRAWLGEGWKAELHPSAFPHQCNWLVVAPPGPFRRDLFAPTDYLVRDERGAVERKSAEAMASEFRDEQVIRDQVRTRLHKIHYSWGRTAMSDDPEECYECSVYAKHAIEAMATEYEAVEEVGA